MWSSSVLSNSLLGSSMWSSSVWKGDVGAILGWGFAPWSGGPFGWTDIKGLKNVVEICNKLSLKEGKRFLPPKLLTEMANNNENFYGKYLKKDDAA